MLFSTTFTALLTLGVGIASASDGFDIHPEQPDGVYTVATKHSAKFHDQVYGEPVLVRSYSPTNTSSYHGNSTIPVLGTNKTLGTGHSDNIAPAPVEKLSLPITYASSACTGSYDKLNFWDYAEALRALGARCDGGETIPSSGWTANSMIYSKVGSAVVYACSSGGRKLPFTLIPVYLPAHAREPETLSTPKWIILTM